MHWTASKLQAVEIEPGGVSLLHVCEKARHGRQKIWNKSLQEAILGVAPALFDALNIPLDNMADSAKRSSHDKVKLANPCWQSQVGVCERLKNSRQTRWQSVGDK